MEAQVSVDKRLLALLQCPSCGEDVVQSESSIVCAACNRKYPIRDGIPDMRVYTNLGHSSTFNESQARYEAELHDAEARSDYEQIVVRMFGTKTRLIASGWSRDILDASCETVLDYGCGTGQLSRVLSRTISPLFAFDISEVSLRQNIEQNGVLGVLGNALFLPFRHGAFDAVCINGVLHHIVDLDRASAEIARVATRLVFVSEGVPRGRPSLARALSYPGVGRISLYASYVIVWAALQLPLVFRAKVWSLLGEPRKERESHGSKYERPLAADSVVSLLGSQGLILRKSQMWTNVDIVGKGPVKRWLTLYLKNPVFGTHFDLVVEKRHA